MHSSFLIASSFLNAWSDSFFSMDALYLWKPPLRATAPVHTNVLTVSTDAVLLAEGVSSAAAPTGTEKEQFFPFGGEGRRKGKGGFKTPPKNTAHTNEHRPGCVSIFHLLLLHAAAKTSRTLTASWNIISLTHHRCQAAVCHCEHSHCT
jgi:hypothetical protein